jgi:hypothetical protein
LVEEQRPWEELVERYSDFYEAPIPASQAGQQDPMEKNKGRFRDIQRNNLMNLLSEAEYISFLDGGCVTDFIFFEQEVGTLGTPMRGAAGWYLPRLIRRSKPPKRLPMDEATVMEMTRDDFLTTNLARFAQELIQKSEVYGLELPGT